MSDERPNVLLQGGELDGQRLHLGRAEEPRTYTAPNGQVYEATKEWENELLIYRISQLRVPPRRQS
jgi:hypothetical protein